MGKTGKWFKSFLSGGGKTKDQKNYSNNASHVNHQQKRLPDRQQQQQQQQNNPTTPNVVPRPTTPKEKKRWSFRRSSAGPREPNNSNNNEATVTSAPAPPPVEQEKHAMAVAAATAAATDAAVAAAKAAAVVIQLSGVTDGISSGSASRRDMFAEETAALKIQSVFRSYLARKALKALRGLVKLQALVRGHLVRKQATATLRCMQALVTAQARARAQRVRAVDVEGKITNHRHSTNRRHSQERIKHSYQDMEENIKIVEMDHGDITSNNSKSRNSYSTSNQSHPQNFDRMDNRISTYYNNQRAYTKPDYQHASPAPSAMTDISPRTCSGHFEDYTFATAQSSPQCYSIMSKPDPSQTPFSFPNPDYADTMSYDFPLYPNYMANTESSRAKVRSQSAPKQRPEFERQPSRGRRPSVEGRNIPRGAKMQRSSSQVSSAAQSYQYPWSIKLDKSNVSLKESECGSTCSVFTNANYARSLVSYDPRY